MQNGLDGPNTYFRLDERQLLKEHPHRDHYISDFSINFAFACNHDAYI